MQTVTQAFYENCGSDFGFPLVFRENFLPLATKRLDVVELSYLKFESHIEWE